jgi:hypothetical protein
MAPARGSYWTRRGMFGWLVADRAPAADWAGMGTPGRPVQYSTPVLGAVLGRVGVGAASAAT